MGDPFLDGAKQRFVDDAAQVAVAPRQLGKKRADPVPVDPDLPTTSPFFAAETGEQAAKRLRELFADPEDAPEFSKAVLALRRTKDGSFHTDRWTMSYGVSLLDEDYGRSPLVGWQLDDMIMIASMAKLAILYAAVQLRADVEVILRTNGIAATGEPAERLKDALDAVARAFRRSHDPALQQIGSDPSKMPVLERIFPLDEFLGGPANARQGQPLTFVTQAHEGGGGIDQLPFDKRLDETIRWSDNRAATSCIADIGLPYIQALLSRTGLADVSGPGKGLWLGSPYGAWPSRKRGERSVTSGLLQRECVELGSRDKSGWTGQAGTVRAIATFYYLMKQRQLVSGWDSDEIQGRLKGTQPARILSGLASRGTVLEAASKIGIFNNWFHDGALMISEAPPPKAGDPDAGFGRQRRTWIAVILLSNDGSSETSQISEMAPELEDAVQDYLVSIWKRRTAAAGTRDGG